MLLKKLKDVVSYLMFLCAMPVVIAAFFFVVLAIPMTVVYGLEYAKKILSIIGFPI